MPGGGTIIFCANIKSIYPYLVPSNQRSGFPVAPLLSLTYTEAIASLNGGLNLVAQIDKRKKQSGERPLIVGTDYSMNGNLMKQEWFAKPLHGALLANLGYLDNIM